MSALVSAFEETLRVARIVERLGRVRRITRHPNGELESDTTHTVMLALTALSIAAISETRDGLELDLELVLVFALVHDMPEAFAGDVPTLRVLSPEERKAKDEAERAAIARIGEDAPWLRAAIGRYEAQIDPEARLVRVLDKCMPKITHLWDGCSVPREHGMDLEELKDRVSKQSAKLRREAPDVVVAHEYFDWLDELLVEAWDGGTDA